MCLRLNTSAGATSASITVQRAALFAGVAMSKAHVTGRAKIMRKTIAHMAALPLTK